MATGGPKWPQTAEPAPIYWEVCTLHFPTVCQSSTQLLHIILKDSYFPKCFSHLLQRCSIFLPPHSHPFSHVSEVQQDLSSLTTLQAPSQTWRPAKYSFNYSLGFPQLPALGSSMPELNRIPSDYCSCRLAAVIVPVSIPWGSADSDWSCHFVDSLHWVKREIIQVKQEFSLSMGLLFSWMLCAF